MESYIVRIYRREGAKPGCRMLGIVETLGAKGMMAFTDYDGLWEILNAGEGKGYSSTEEQGEGEDGE